MQNEQSSRANEDSGWESNQEPYLFNKRHNSSACVGCQSFPLPSASWKRVYKKTSQIFVKMKCKFDLDRMLIKSAPVQLCCLDYWIADIYGSQRGAEYPIEHFDDWMIDQRTFAYSCRLWAVVTSDRLRGGSGLLAPGWRKTGILQKRLTK